MSSDPLNIALVNLRIAVTTLRRMASVDREQELLIIQSGPLAAASVIESYRAAAREALAEIERLEK